MSKFLGFSLLMTGAKESIEGASGAERVQHSWRKNEQKSKRGRKWKEMHRNEDEGFHLQQKVLVLIWRSVQLWRSSCTRATHTAMSDSLIHFCGGECLANPACDNLQHHLVTSTWNAEDSLRLNFKWLQSNSVSLWYALWVFLPPWLWSDCNKRRKHILKMGNEKATVVQAASWRLLLCMRSCLKEAWIPGWTLSSSGNRLHRGDAYLSLLPVFGCSTSKAFNSVFLKDIKSIYACWL